MEKETQKQRMFFFHGTVNVAFVFVVMEETYRKEQLFPVVVIFSFICRYGKKGKKIIKQEYMKVTQFK